MKDLAGILLILFCLSLPIIYPASIIFSFIWAAVMASR